MSKARPRIHSATLTPREALLFEAGIKLGGVFHQYLGIPLSARTAPALARAIESAVALQPFVERVEVRIHATPAGPRPRGRFGYQYLTAEMLQATVTLRDGPVRVVARLAHRRDLGYPLMAVVAVSDRPGRKKSGHPRASRGTRSART